MPNPMFTLRELASKTITIFQIMEDTIAGKNGEDDFRAKVNYTENIVSVEYRMLVNNIHHTVFMHIKVRYDECQYMGDFLSIAGLKAFSLAGLIYMKIFGENTGNIIFNQDKHVRSYFPEVALGF